jgi:hypothetical protein
MTYNVPASLLISRVVRYFESENENGNSGSYLVRKMESQVPTYELPTKLWLHKQSIFLHLSVSFWDSCGSSDILSPFFSPVHLLVLLPGSSYLHNSCRWLLLLIHSLPVFHLHGYVLSDQVSIISSFCFVPFMAPNIN